MEEMGDGIDGESNGSRVEFKTKVEEKGLENVERNRPREYLASEKPKKNTTTDR